MTKAQFQALAQILRLRQGSTREAVRLHLVAGLTVPDAARVAGVKYQLALKATKRAKDGHKLAIAATSEQQKAVDPFDQAIDSAAKRLAAMGITMSWTTSYLDSGMERVPVYFPGTYTETGEYKIEQARPAATFISVQLLYPASINPELRGYKVTSRIEFPTYMETRIEFRGIEEVEHFIAENAHLAN